MSGINKSRGVSDSGGPHTSKKRTIRITPRMEIEFANFFASCCEAMRKYGGEFEVNKSEFDKMSGREKISSFIERADIIKKSTEESWNLAVEILSKKLSVAEAPTELYIKKQFAEKPWLKQYFLDELHTVYDRPLKSSYYLELAEDILSLSTCSEAEFHTALMLRREMANDATEEIPSIKDFVKKIKNPKKTRRKRSSNLDNFREKAALPAKKSGSSRRSASPGSIDKPRERVKIRARRMFESVPKPMPKLPEFKARRLW